MASWKHPGLFRRAMSPLLLTLAGLLFAHPFAWANQTAVPTGKFQVDGKDVSLFGREACEPGSAAVWLPEEVYRKAKNFRTTKRGVTAHEKKPACQATFSATNAGVEFSKGQAIPFDKLLPASACNDEKGDSGRLLLCIYQSDEPNELLAQIPYGFETVMPVIENFKDEMAANGTATFEVVTSAQGLVEEVITCYGKSQNGMPKDRMPTDDCKAPFRKHESKTLKVTIPNLENGIKYYFRVRIKSTTGSEGKWSELFDLTPKIIENPLGLYDGSENPFSAGCGQSSPPSSWLLYTLGALWLWFLRRSKAKQWHNGVCALCLVALGVVLLPRVSYAYPGQVNLGLVGAPYRPNIDSEKRANGKPIFPIYKCFFRKELSDDKGPLLPFLGLEADVHLWYGLQVGMGLQYAYAKGFGLEMPKSKIPDCNLRSDLPMGLHMLQLKPQVTYIAPFIGAFPLTLFVRAALIAHGYSFTDNGSMAKSHARGAATYNPLGVSFGYQGALGLLFKLDFLEPSAVRDASSAGYFEHIYLKAELAYAQIDNFGQGGFIFSPQDVMGSELPLMWNFGLVFELP